MGFFIITSGCIMVGLGVVLASTGSLVSGVLAAGGVFIVAGGVLGQALRDARKYLK